MTIEPCPFCGFHDVQIGEPDFNRAAVDCPECECIGPIKDSVDDAIAAWNDAHKIRHLLAARCDALTMNVRSNEAEIDRLRQAVRT